jgi:Histidine kinase-, DNA gyrase B-, and HSP90-like ATPase
VNAVKKAPPYKIRISRLTIDKLGVRLYDKVSAVVAELVANSFDGDAEAVTVRLPLGTELGHEDHLIEVIDDGHGMTPTEAQDYFLKVGNDRRARKKDGKLSRGKKRKVMGRKGIGKLAPFGICRRIEVISSGGEETGKGYLTSHFVMDFDRIVRDKEGPVALETGARDRTWSLSHGTTVRLSRFLPKRVPAEDTFVRQLARRFVLGPTLDFKIYIEDTRTEHVKRREVPPFVVPIMPATEIRVDGRPVILEDGTEFAVTGWLGLAKDAYKNEEMAGVRIYARNKIVATTRDFEQPAGYTGEFTTRSYLVGEIQADWLDDDAGEDLIRTDRQGILWDSDRGEALRKWGAELIREIGAASREPRRVRVRDLFLKKAQLEAKSKERYGDDEAVVATALELGRQIGAFAAEDELEDETYVSGLVEVILSVAPHRALITAFQVISNQVDKSVDDMLRLFARTRVAELASYAQIADERIRSIEELSELIYSGKADERDLQALLARAPWLINTSWTVISENQELKTFRDMFVRYWKERTGNNIEIAISYEKKRPDFTLVNVSRRLEIVELKKPGHAFEDDDYDRLENYLEAFEAFAEGHPEVMKDFPDGWAIDLVVDKVNIKDTTKRRAFRAEVTKKRVTPVNWKDFLYRCTQAHSEFLAARDRANKAK